MNLKKYQEDILNEDLDAYLSALDESNDIIKAWKNYWDKKDIAIGIDGVPNYKNKILGVPHICMKVPTGGGKTFIACSAVKHIFQHMPLDKPKVVVWLVPSDSILTQTIRTLSDATHPYRQQLDKDFAGRVGVYTKEMLLNGQNFSPDTVREMLTVCVLSYASLRINSKKKDVRKVYQENGNLIRFAETFTDQSLQLENTSDTALIQVLRQLSPVTIVDESHNAGSKLSVEMLDNLNPSFIMELTATPRASSNIISYVDARKLKSENMVKLPVVVFNRSSRQAVIQDAIQLRGNIEKQAINEYRAGGEYIRPIVLFQAQPKINSASETFDKIKELLIEMGIPEEQIAIKTSNVDDIGMTDLMSPESKIRYIITVNALKEGWDCPFAYILASLANKTSKVDVEQIVGRILRQPYTKLHKATLLNTSYVLTSSNDFHATLESIVVGLNKSGYSRKDYRIGDENAEQDKVSEEKVVLNDEEEMIPGLLLKNADDKKEQKDDFADIDLAEMSSFLVNSEDDKDDSVETETPELVSMISAATTQIESYNEEIKNASNNGFVGGELGEMLKQNGIQPQYQQEIANLKIPQFYIQSEPDLFGDCYELLEAENLSEGFSLNGQDAQIDFSLASGEMYKVDVQKEGEAVPKYKRASQTESEYIKKYLESLPPEKRLKQCSQMIAKQINKNNRFAAIEIDNYIQRVISNMTDDDLSTIETSIPTYAFKIQKKIEKLELSYRIKTFKKWLDSGKLLCRESYVLPPVITPSVTTDSIPYSLYEAEKDDMNGFEKQVIDLIVGTDNIRWWHRIIEKKDFYLNGFIRHYPDFMIMTKSGKLLLIEVKGDYLDGEDSKSKLSLGRKWQEQAGRMYRYFMVFKEKELGLEGAYTLEQFVDIMKEI